MLTGHAEITVDKVLKIEYKVKKNKINTNNKLGNRPD